MATTTDMVTVSEFERVFEAAEHRGQALALDVVIFHDQDGLARLCHAPDIITDDPIPATPMYPANALPSTTLPAARMA